MGHAPPLPPENLQHLGQLQVASEIALILLVKYQNQYYDSWEFSGGGGEGIASQGGSPGPPPLNNSLNWSYVAACIIIMPTG